MQEGRVGDMAGLCTSLHAEKGKRDEKTGKPSDFRLSPDMFLFYFYFILVNGISYSV